MNLKFFIVFSIINITFYGCNKESSQAGVIASVGHDNLTYNDIKSIVPKGVPTADSIEILRNYVESWVRDKMLVREAERVLENDDVIDKLVQEYKESLLVHQYKKKVFSEELDSTISNDKIQQYYLENKEDYIVNSPLYLVGFIRMSRLHPDIEEFQKLWDATENILESDISAYCKVGNTRCIKDSTIWLNNEGLQALINNAMPGSENFKEGEKYSTKLNEEFYFLQIIKKKKQGDIKPFHSVKDNISVILLNNKKSRLTEDLTKELYSQGLSEGWIKIYIE